MLRVYKYEEIPVDKVLVKNPWDEYFWDNIRKRGLTEEDIDIVEGIDKSKVINPVTIQSKFDSRYVDLSRLSDGCKTILAIKDMIKTGGINDVIVDINSCGGNAISYLAENLAKEQEVNVCLNHCDFGNSKNCDIYLVSEGVRLNSARAAGFTFRSMED